MPTAEGRIWMSEEAYNQVGSSWPQEVVKNYTIDALNHIGVDSNISIPNDYGFSELDVGSPSDTHLYAVSSAFSDYVSQHDDLDFNLCLLKNEFQGAWGTGGGYSAVLSHVNWIDQVPSSTSYPRKQQGFEYYMVRSAVHEIGHCLGAQDHQGAEFEVFDSAYGPPGMTSLEVTPMTHEDYDSCTGDHNWSDYPVVHDMYYYDGCTKDRIHNRLSDNIGGSL